MASVGVGLTAQLGAEFSGWALKLIVDFAWFESAFVAAPVIACPGHFFVQPQSSAPSGLTRPPSFPCRTLGVRSLRQLLVQAALVWLRLHYSLEVMTCRLQVGAGRETGV